MLTACAFLGAAAVGSLVRLAARGLSSVRMPWGTLAVNLAGSFALGLVAGWSPPAATIVGSAGLGAFTTFSTFADELVTGWSLDRRAVVAYLVLSLAGGVALAWWGLRIAG